MNKIAVISDVHSNIFALTEFVKKVRGEVDEIYCCGDILGYYPYQEETIEIFNKYNIVSIRGNHDKYIIDSLLPRRSNRMLEKSIAYGRKRLNKKIKDFIRALPDVLKFKRSGVKINIFHGLFKDCEMHIHKEELDLYLRRESNLAKAADFNFFGHTHMPFMKRKSGKVFVNVGSLGYPRNSKPSYVIFELDKKNIKKYYFQYPMENLKRDIKKQELDGDYKKMLLKPIS